MPSDEKALRASLREGAACTRRATTPNLGPRHAFARVALTLARHTIHNLQPDLDVLKAGRKDYASNAATLIAAGEVVAIEFQTIAAANNYWR